MDIMPIYGYIMVLTFRRYADEVANYKVPYNS